MSPTEHYVEAERLLTQANEKSYCNETCRANILREAQVHATLAQSRNYHAPINRGAGG